MKRVLQYSLVVLAVACLVGLVSSDAQAFPFYGGNCTGCHSTPEGNVDVLDPTQLLIGEDGQVVFTVTDLPAASGSIALTGLDAAGLGATVGAGWTDQGGVYTSDFIGGLGDVTLDLAIDSGATLGDYGIGVQFAGHNAGNGKWGTASDFTISVVPVPEPTTVAMLLSVGIVGLVLRRRRRNK